MYTVNSKTRLDIFVILADMLLSGCQARNGESPQSENSGVSSVRFTESVYDSSTVSDERTIESFGVSPKQPEESGFSSEEEPPQNGYEFFCFEKTYTAEYIDSSRKLNSIVFDI